MQLKDFRVPVYYNKTIYIAFKHRSIPVFIDPMTVYRSRTISSVGILSSGPEGRAIYGNLENKINTLYWPVENSIPKNNDRSSVFHTVS
jgi:hypothetical protein